VKDAVLCQQPGCGAAMRAVLQDPNDPPAKGQEQKLIDEISKREKEEEERLYKFTDREFHDRLALAMRIGENYISFGFHSCGVRASFGKDELFDKLRPFIRDTGDRRLVLIICGISIKQLIEKVPYG
jgi:hypothetical protein